MNARIGAALMVLCTAVCLWFSPGRISVPDDEIVFQTTRSLWERGELAIEGIPRRTGELEGRPDGTFGWAPGVDGRRYGFFGHALSFVALPAYGLGKVAARHAPDAWRHAVRSDHYWVHGRTRDEDFTRMFVGFTNCWLVGLGAWLFALWVARLGYGPRIAVTCGLAYAFGTSMFPYAGTFLSEPLSAVWLIAAGLAVTGAHQAREAHDDVAAKRGWIVAAACMGAAVHTHVLNVVAVPVYLGWALWPWATAWSRRATWWPALVVGAIGLGLVGLSQWARFGDPLQTGRYDHYSHFIAPGRGLLAMLIGPGRSVWLYSPALLVASFGFPAMWRRHRALTLMILATFATRWVFVAARSDWWGGWAIGSRYLLPVVPLLLLPLAEVLRAATTPARRFLVGGALVGCALACAFLAEHSIFDHMLRLAAAGSDADPYLVRSHWAVDATPWVGFVDLPPDMLSMGARTLAEHGHSSLWWVFLAIAMVATLAAFDLGRQLWRSAPGATAA